MSPVLAGRFFTHEPPGKVLVNYGKMNLLLKNKIKVANIYNNIKKAYMYVQPQMFIMSQIICFIQVISLKVKNTLIK